MIIGIVGLGFVGGAMYASFCEKNIITHGYDKYKNGGIGNIQSILICDIIFLALPTPYDDNIQKYDIGPIHELCTILNDNNYTGPVIIKSTVEPYTANILSCKYTNLHIIHNPEFLSAKTAYDDFNNQTHIILGKATNCSYENLNKIEQFYKVHFPNAKISLCTSNESESVKLFANSFYATKVQFFTELYLLCNKMDCDYNNIKSMLLKNNWINSMHTTVPGSDGKISYGGLCFPKDTNALNSFMEKLNVPHKVLENVINERNELRDD